MEQTLYYTLSTIAQVLVALAAVFGVFMNYRMKELKNLLIGHGNVFVARHFGDVEKERSEIRSHNDYKMQIKRLRDSVYRKSIPGVEAGMVWLAKAEIETTDWEVIQEQHKTGHYLHVYPVFRKTLNHYRNIQWVTIVLLAIMGVGIISSVVYLAKVDLLMAHRIGCPQKVLNFHVWLTSFCALGTIVATAYSFLGKAKMEDDKYTRKEKEALESIIKEKNIPRLCD